jgi:hypothetical protein
MDNSELQIALESLIDKHGLRAVLNEISEICELKAEHLSRNWQDAVGETLWFRASRKILRVATGLNSALSPK